MPGCMSEKQFSLMKIKKMPGISGTAYTYDKRGYPTTERDTDQSASLRCRRSIIILLSLQDNT